MYNTVVILNRLVNLLVTRRLLFLFAKGRGEGLCI
jgi:hypothetical protein